MNDATSSWLVAQPTISSAGPGIAALVLRLGPLSTACSGDEVAPSWISQTSDGSTSASSRITRSQSKRLFARLVTVAERASCRLRKSANLRRLWARAVATSRSLSSCETSALRSLTCFELIASAPTAIRTTASIPTRT